MYFAADAIALHFTRVQTFISSGVAISNVPVKFAIPITAIVAAVMAIHLGHSTITRPPAHLRVLPQASFFGYLGRLIKLQPINQVTKELTELVASKSSHGMYVRFDINGWAIHVTRPEIAKLVLLKQDIFPKGEEFIESRKGTLSGRLIVQRNIVFSTGSDWKAQRMIANPAFHRSMPIQLFGRLTQKVFTQMDFETENSIEFRGLIERLTLDSIGMGSFGFNFNAIDNPQSEWKVRYDSVFKAAIDPRYLLFPFVDRHLLFLFPKRRRMHQELTKFHEMMQQVIDEKRAKLAMLEASPIDNGSQVLETDLLTLMLAAGEEGNNTLSDELLKNNLCIFFIAGHESSTNALCSAVYHLAVNQDIQQKAREEANRVLGGQGVNTTPTIEQARELKYIDMIAREALRMNPPISMTVPRTAAEDTELGGVFIPKGTKVIVDIQDLHHNTTVWKDPYTFDPERFALNGEAEQLMKKTSGIPWAPFGYGSRQCIGMNFTMFQKRVFLSMLLRKYQWSLPEDSRHKEQLQTHGHSVVAIKDLHINFERIN